MATIEIAIPDTVEELLIEAGDTYPGTLAVVSLYKESIIFTDSVRIPVRKGQVLQSKHSWVAQGNAIVYPLHLYDASGMMVGVGEMDDGIPVAMEKGDELILSLTLTGLFKGCN